MANKIYGTPETAISFKETAGDVTFTPKNVANNAGRISAQWDRGSGAKPTIYKWRAHTKAAAALAVGQSLEIWFATSDGTDVDGNQGTTDAAFAASDKRRNLQYVGSIFSDSVTNGEVQIGSGLVEIRDRYVSVVWWNTFGQALTNTAGDHTFTLTAVPDEIQ
jgi:hypothetical protein